MPAICRFATFPARNVARVPPLPHHHPRRSPVPLAPCQFELILLVMGRGVPEDG
jgi:hypothetical protein